MELTSIMDARVQMTQLERARESAPNPGFGHKLQEWIPLYSTMPLF
jgi:hypothetical protein